MNHRQQVSISAGDLFARLGTAAAPIVIDVRRDAAFAAAERLIASAFHADPDQVAQWGQALARDRDVVAYCMHGHEVSQGVAVALRAAGVRAAYLEAGISGWVESKLPTRRKRVAASEKWVTRERPKIDRIACPWLVSRFINPGAEFIYVPADQVATTAASINGTPYDIPGAEFGHAGDRCSFDAIIEIYDLHDAALDRLATIVRGADTSRPDLSPQCEGLLAISYGLSNNFPSDHDMLRHGMVIYDALYAWCRTQDSN